MKTELINGHNQFVFSDKEEQDIIEKFKNGYSCRQIWMEYGVSQKPIMRVLDKYDIDHSRGNLTSFVPYYNKIYDSDIERQIDDSIKSLVYAKIKRKYYVNEEYFDMIDNQDKAYILGFLYADGCNHGTGGISISLEESDKMILEEMRNAIGIEAPLRYVDNSNKHDFGYTYKNQYCMSISSYHMAHVLSIRGMMPNKSLILEFPQWLKPELYSHFIRGIFDGDGSLYRYDKNGKQNTVVTITSTENFCKAVIDICAQYVGIRGHFYDASCHNGVTRVFSICGRDICKKFLDWIYDDAQLFLQRKYDRYCSYYGINNSLIN